VEIVENSWALGVDRYARILESICACVEAKMMYVSEEVVDINPLVMEIAEDVIDDFINISPVLYKLEMVVDM
jgi:hypothetical protein